MSTHKSLSNNDYKIEQYTAYASQSFTVVSGSGIYSPEFTLNIATEPPANWLETGKLGIVNSDSGISANVLFKSINHLFYTQGTQIYYSSSVIENVTKYSPSQSAYVLSAATTTTGTGIKPNSVNIKVNSLSTYIYDEPTPLPQVGLLKTSNTGTVIGNVFYTYGIFILKDNRAASVATINSSGVKIVYNDVLTVEFQSTIDIYKHRISCEIEPNEFNMSWFNPSVSGSYASSGSILGQGTKIYDLMASGSLTPYVTSIGLYNDEYQLLAVAKLSSPIKRSFFTKQTFVVQFDTN